jgi:hypothetical protein
MKRGWFFGILLIAMVGVLLGLWPFFRVSTRGAQHRPGPPVFIHNQQNQALQKAAEAYQKPPPPDISAAILKEAERSGQLDSHPQATEERLNVMAAKLSPAEVQQMAEVVKAPSNNGDLRSLAVELLVRNKNEGTLTSLEEIILSKWPTSADPRITGFEQALRARAIEGLEAHPSTAASKVLENALARTEDPFLKDHAQRAYLHRQGQVRSVEEQDQEALKKILNR